MRRYILILFICLHLAACATTSRNLLSLETSFASPEASQLTVMAAASLTEAFTEIEAVYESQHDVDVIYSFAGSQQLAQQIHSGAPADVFASANQKQMNRVIDDGLIDPDTVRLFARNHLVIIFPSRNPAGIQEMGDLARPGVSIVLASEEVPVGRYTLEFLDNAANDATLGASFRAGVLENVVSYENSVKSVLTKVMLDEVDAGIVYISDLTGPAVEHLESISIPEHLNVTAVYPIAPLMASSHPDQAQEFIDFVLSEESQRIIVNNGLLTAVK